MRIVGQLPPSSAVLLATDGLSVGLVRGAPGVRVRFAARRDILIERDSRLLSVVVPCFNEEEVIGETIRRLQAFCDSLVNLRVELIFVDDGSHDRTRQLLRDFAAADDRVRVIGFARNFGHQIAVTAGIEAASGDAVVLIDADLQDRKSVV